MPGGFMALDQGLPWLDGKDTEERLRAMTDYLVQVLEQLRYTLRNLGERNINGAEWEKISNKVVFTALGEEGATVINGGNITTGTIDASKVRVDHISADDITAGTLRADVVEVVNLNASNITNGDLDASVVTIVNLSAASLTGGTLTGIDISGGHIYGADVYGGKLRTAQNAAEDVWVKVGSKTGSPPVWGLLMGRSAAGQPDKELLAICDEGGDEVSIAAKEFTFLTTDAVQETVTAEGSWEFLQDVQLPAGSQYPTRTEVQAMIDASIAGLGGA